MAESPAPSTPLHVTAEDVKWDVLPQGVRRALLVGDPSKAGPFTLRMKLPPGHRIGPHWHPSDEQVTVLAGTVTMGVGDVYDLAGVHAMSTGGFMVIPAELRHFAYTKDGATVQIHGIGPFTTTYVNPADDPRKPAEPEK